MSSTVNHLSEATTQFNRQTGKINRSKIENNPINSSELPRQSSVTVIGKKILSYSCISPEAIEEKSRYPIPIKVMTRLKRQNTQVKTLIKQKTLKNLKIKCLEQPSPLKHLVIPNPFHPKPESKDKSKIAKKKVVENSKKVEKKSPERSPSNNIKKLIKHSILTEIKKRKREEHLQSKEKKKELNKKIMLDERNSKIRLDNSSKFKMSRFKPKVPWGVDTRWAAVNEKTLASIKKQRNTRRALKKSPEYQLKKSIGLSDYIEIGQDLGFKRCKSSSSKPEASPKSCKKRSPVPSIRTYIKLKKKKTKETKKNAVIEEVKKETKRVQNLKKLEVGIKGVPKHKLSLTYRGPRLKDLENEIHQIYNEKSFQQEELQILKEKHFLSHTENSEKNSVDFPLETKSSNKFNDKPLGELEESSNVFLYGDLEKCLDCSGKNPGTEEGEKSSKGELGDKRSFKEDFFELQNSAARKIQKFFKRFFRKKNLAEENSENPGEEDEVEGIIYAWKNMRDVLSNGNADVSRVECKDPVQHLEEMKKEELKKVQELAKEVPGNQEVLHSLTEMIGNRYNHLAEIFQSHKNDNFGIPEIENESSEQSCLQNLSFPSSHSENSLDSPESFTENMRKKIETLINEKKNVNENLSKIPDAGPFETSSRGERPAESSESSLKQKKLTKQSISSQQSLAKARLEKYESLISSELIVSSAEDLIEKLLEEVLSSDFLAALPIEKSVICYGRDLIKNLGESEFNEWMSRPLDKDPLSVLKMMHSEVFGYTEEFYNIRGSKVLPLDLFNSISSQRQGGFRVGKGYFYQKLNDRLLFDSFNEVLDKIRLFGTDGKPMPWEKTTDKLSQKFEVDKVMQSVFSEVEKMRLLDNGSVRSLDSSVFDKKYIEGKVGSLIIRDVLENHKIWVNYTFEEAQAYINAGELVIEELIDEVIRFLRD